MSSLVGSVPGATSILMYPDKPGLKAWLETPNPDGYTEQMGQFGTRAGTILPHHSARTSFEQLRKQKHNVPTSVVSIQNPTSDNPMGGMQVLIPSFDMNGVTPEMMNRAREQVKSMTDDRAEQDVLMFKLLADEVRGVKPTTPAPNQTTPQESVPMSQPVAPPSVPEQPAVPALPIPAGLTPEMLVGLLLQQMQQKQAAALPTPVAAQPQPQPAPPAAPPTPMAPPVFIGAPQQAGPAIPTTAKLFECLGIPDLDVQAVRPRAQVTIKLGKLGGQTANYHWVLQEPNALYLVFDTRYDYPMYTPPNLGPEELIEVELANVQGGPQRFTCCSCGMSFRFGVFQIFILLIPAGA